MNDHILSTYDDELNELRSIVVRMGELATDQLMDAMRALKELDTDLAKKVRLADMELDRMEMNAERAVIGIFARRAPVADDLREVVAALKMTTMVERMGDYAKNIAKRAQEIAEGPIAVMPHMLSEMATEAHQMIQDVMDAYIQRNINTAIEVWERDETLDNMYSAAYRQTLARMVEAPEHIGILTHYLMIAKNLERIGDQSTNVAEQVHYAVTGDILEEARLKRDSTTTELYS